MGRLKIAFLILFRPNFSIILRCSQGVIRTSGSFPKFDLEDVVFVCLHYELLVKASFPGAILMTQKE